MDAARIRQQNLEKGLLPLYRLFLDDYAVRLRQYGELDLAHAFQEWRQHLEYSRSESPAFFQVATERLTDIAWMARLQIGNPPRDGAILNRSMSCTPGATIDLPLEAREMVRDNGQVFHGGNSIYNSHLSIQ